MLGLATLVIAGCTTSETPAASDDASPLHVYATTGYLSDAVSNIAPDAEVTTMVGPGGDPHTFQPSTRDIEALMEADVVVWNGLVLEAQMIDLIESRGDAQLAAGEVIPESLLITLPETDEDGNALVDPHVWNSPDAWTIAVGAVAEKLADIDPENADEYLANAEGYQAEIAQAAAEAEALLADVPEPRILITGHDAFNYFGTTYDFTVYATDVISSEAALSAAELSELATLIATEEVPVIFQDNQANPQAITSLREAVAALGWNVTVSDDALYADSLGSEPGVDTYLGVFLHNARTIADALDGRSTQ